MNASYAAERQRRRNVTGPLDYDDSDVSVLAAARLLRRTDLSPAASRALGFLVHWGYGSLVGRGRAAPPPLPAGGGHHRVLGRPDGHGVRAVPRAG
jgi:hypothetical protein